MLPSTRTNSEFCLRSRELLDSPIGRFLAGERRRRQQARRQLQVPGLYWRDTAVNEPAIIAEKARTEITADLRHSGSRRSRRTPTSGQKLAIMNG